MTVFDWSEGSKISAPEGFSRWSAKGQDIQVLRLAASPGVGSRPEHHHVNEQCVVVLEGGLDLTVDGHVHTLGPGQGCIVPSNVPHSAQIGDEGVVLIEIYSPPRPDGAGELAASV